MVDADAGGALEAEGIEIIGESATIARASASEDQVGEDGAGARAFARIDRSTGGDQQCHGRRLHAGHFFAEQGEAIGEGVLEVAFGQSLLLLLVAWNYRRGDVDC